MTLLNSTQNEHSFHYSLSGDQLDIFSNLENHECHFVIADKEGFVLMKGKFIEKKRFSLQELNTTEFDLVLFNEECHCSYPIKINS